MAALKPILTTPPSAPPPADTNDIRGIKPPVDIPNDWAWLGWTLLALALIALGVWAWLWWRKKRATPPVAVVIPPHVRAKQRLTEALALIHDPRLFCIAVSDAVRVYLEERFDYRAPERTTEEFLAELHASSSLYPDQKQGLAEFLQNCDLVKFARFEPTESALRELHESAVRLVEETQFFETVPSVRMLEATAPPVASPTASEDTGEPFTLKDRAIGFAIASSFILIGLATWLWPHLQLVPDDLQAGGRGSRRFVGILRLIEWLWSRPVGTLLAMVGLAVLYGVFTRKTKGKVV